MATEEEKDLNEETKKAEEQKEEQKPEQDTSQSEDNAGGSESGDNGDKNPVELSKRRQRKELRKADDESKAEVAKGILENVRLGGGTPQPVSEPGGATTPAPASEREVPITPAVVGNDVSDANDSLEAQESAQQAEIQSQQEQVAAAQKQPAATPTSLPDQVQADYNTVAAGVAPTDSAGAKATEKTAEETSQKLEQENKTLTEPAQEMYNRGQADIAAARQAYADAQEKYNVPSTQEIIDQKVDKEEWERMSPVERRRMKRKAEREREARKEQIYRELDPTYRDSKDFKREQNLKNIIGAIGKLGTLAGRTVTAFNGGMLLPTKDFTDGLLEDVRISAKEREALLRAYDDVRKKKIQEPLDRLQAAEKRQLDLVKSPASYNNNRLTNAGKSTSGTERTVEKKKEKIDYKDWFEANGGGKKLFGKLQNGEYIIPGIYSNGMPTGAHKVTVDVFNNATGKLFDVFRNLPGITTKNGNITDENGNIWVDLHQLQEYISGATDAGTREKLQQRYIEYLDKMLKYMEKSDSEEAKEALTDYSNLLKRASLDYMDYSEQGSGSTQQNPKDDDFRSLVASWK